MNDVKISTQRVKFMASSLVCVLLLCITPAIIPLSSSIVQSVSSNLARQSIDVGLRFLEEPSDTVVSFNKTAELYCRAQSSYDETITIGWLHNGKKLEDSSQMATNNQVLKIIPRKKSSSVTGVYQCVANITRGLSPAVLISKLAYVKLAKLSSISKSNEDIISSVGKPVRLSCKFTSVPEAVVTWTFQNRSLELSNSRYDTSIPGILYISDVQLSDSGEYRCIVSNPYQAKPKVSSPFHVKINSSGKVQAGETFSFQKSLKNETKITVMSGKNLALECFVLNGEDLSVKWTFLPWPLKEYKEPIFIAYSKYFNILKKSNVTLADAGLYSCAVIRDSKVQEILVYNVTIVVAPRFIVTPESQNTTLAHRINFDCQADGYPPPSIKWFRNGVAVQADARVLIRAEGLQLIFANSDDFGMYQCVASNRYGSVWSSARLYMIDIANPPIPTNVSCVAANSTAVHLRWLQPIDSNQQYLVAFHIGNSGSASNFSYVYVVSFHEANEYHDQQPDQLTQPAASNELVVNSLKPSTEYVFSVRSFHGRSGSNPSMPIACATTVEEAIPFISDSSSCAPSSDCNSASESPITSNLIASLDLQPVNDSAVLVTWHRQAPTDFEIERFFIKYKILGEDQSSTKSVNFEDEKTVLTNLECGKVYEIFLIFYLNDTELTINSGKITTPHRLHLNVSGVSADGFTVFWYSQSNNGNIHYHVLYGEKRTDQLISLINSTVSNITIFNLKPSTDYVVEVREYKDNNSFDFDSAFILARTLPLQIIDTTESSEEAAFHLSNEHIFGILIGLGISLVFVMLCAVAIICCKRHFEKRHRRTSARLPNPPRHVRADEQHEMKVASANLKAHQAASYVNGGNAAAIRAVPILSDAAGPGGYANGRLPSLEFTEGSAFSDFGSTTLRGESEQLLDDSNLPWDDARLTAPRLNERDDHEGGDSGYCDRNHSPSPRSADCERSRRRRKCSDGAADDGFYECEFQSFGAGSSR